MLRTTIKRKYSILQVEFWVIVLACFIPFSHLKENKGALPPALNTEIKTVHCLEKNIFTNCTALQEMEKA